MFTSSQVSPQSAAGSSGDSTTGRRRGFGAGRIFTGRRTALAAAVLISALIVPAAAASTTTPAIPGSQVSGMNMFVNEPGYHVVFADDFNGDQINTTQWSRYNQTTAASNGRWARENVLVQNGRAILRGERGADARSSVKAGMSNNVGGSQTYGKWKVRFRAQQSNGLSYVFLLYPVGGGWPPEIDFAEDGGGARDRTLNAFHYDTDNKQIIKKVYKDFTQWHTAGLTWEPGLLQYTMDGVVTQTITGSIVPNIPMWIGVQSGAYACDYTEYINCPFAVAPPVVDTEIDWVVRFQKN